jgi:hypothetical protein
MRILYTLTYIVALAAFSKPTNYVEGFVTKYSVRFVDLCCICSRLPGDLSASVNCWGVLSLSEIHEVSVAIIAGHGV